MELFLMLPGGKAGYFFPRVMGLLAVFRIRKLFCAPKYRTACPLNPWWSGLFLLLRYIILQGVCFFDFSISRLWNV